MVNKEEDQDWTLGLCNFKKSERQGANSEGDRGGGAREVQRKPGALVNLVY